LYGINEGSFMTEVIIPLDHPLPWVVCSPHAFITIADDPCSTINVSYA
jgi:hypothetical protein